MSSQSDQDWPDCDDTVSTPRPIAEKRARLEEIVDGAFTAKKLTVDVIRQLRDWAKKNGDSICLNTCTQEEWEAWIIRNSTENK